MRQDTLDAEAAHEKRSKSCDAQREGRKKRRAASAGKNVQVDEEQGSGSAEEKSAAVEESTAAPTDDGMFCIVIKCPLYYWTRIVCL